MILLLNHKFYTVSKNTIDMDIKIFSHVMDWQNDTSITLEQTELLEKTGLLDAAQEVNIMVHFKMDSFEWLRERWKYRNNVRFHVFGEEYRTWCEATTMHYIQEFAHHADREYYVLYMSNKGVTHPPNDGTNQTEWRHYMQYWNVEKWRECVAHLDEGYDTCGASFLAHEQYSPFYAGNFFWARTSYLRRCKRLKTPAENNFQPQMGHPYHHRYDLEYWHGSGNPKWYDMHPGAYPGEKNFRWLQPAHTYRNDL